MPISTMTSTYHATQTGWTNVSFTTATFRGLVSEISMLLAYEVTRDLPLSEQEIVTPMARMKAPVIDENQKLVLNRIDAFLSTHLK